MTLRHLRSALILAVLLAAVFAPIRPERSGLKPPPLPLPMTIPARPGGPALGSASRPVDLRRNYGRLPMSFEANAGQADSQVRFLARGAGYTLFLSGDAAVLALEPSARRENNARVKGQRPKFKSEKPAVVRMRLVGANRTAKVAGVDELPGRINYFLGSDPAQWRTNVPNYARVKVESVYPGVDLVYYGKRRQLEYDFVVTPGADPRAIRLEIGSDDSGIPASGPTSGPTGRRTRSRTTALRLDAAGDLVVATDGGEVRFHQPVVYQPVRAVGSVAAAAGVVAPASSVGEIQEIQNRRRVDGRYVLKGHEVGFELADYDRAQPLVIDPVLSYASYLGSSRSDFGTGIAVDSSGNAYVTGYTFSADFPTTTARQGFGGSNDVFVAKLNPAGSALVYSTTLGGRGNDVGQAIAVDATGSAYVTGSTDSSDFPTQNAFQGANAGGSEAFVSKLDNSGALVYSTYLGGSSTEAGQGIAVDAAGSAYVTGATISTDFPIQNALQPANGGGYDAFVTKLNPAGDGLVYSTYLGGSADENNPFLSLVNTAGIAVDSAGDAYVAGYTPSQDFPVQNAWQSTLHGPINAFAAKFVPSGDALVYATYLGGRGNDFGHAIAADGEGNAYVTGSTSSPDFPVEGALQASFGGSDDAFIAKFTAGGSLAYSTFLGGSRDDYGLGIAVDAAGNAYVAGFTHSPDFPTLGAFESAYAGGYDAFVTALAPSGAALVYSTYLGGARDDHGAAIALDAQGNAYVAGDTLSPDFPATGGAFQTACGSDGVCGATSGGSTPDAWVAQMAPFNAPGASLSPSGLSFGAQPLGTTSAAQTLTLRNVGSLPLVARTILAVPKSAYTETNNCTAPLAPGASCSIRVSFTPAAPGSKTGFLILLDNAWPRGFEIVRLTGSGL